MSDNLLPCPFCGTPASLDQASPSLFRVVCDDCLCGTIYGDKDWVIHLWNRRHKPDWKDELLNTQPMTKPVTKLQFTTNFNPEKCPVCNGTGEIGKMEDFAYRYSTCPSCNGSKIKTPPCPDCHGSGLIIENKTTPEGLPIDGASRICHCKISTKGLVK